MFDELASHDHRDARLGLGGLSSSRRGIRARSCRIGIADPSLEDASDCLARATTSTTSKKPSTQISFARRYA